MVSKSSFFCNKRIEDCDSHRRNPDVGSLLTLTIHLPCGKTKSTYVIFDMIAVFQ